MSYKIGDKQFKTKQTATDYFKYILHKNEIGSKITGQYYKDIIGLIECHVDKNSKIGCGIDYITTEKHIDVINGFPDKYPHFHIYRKDGTDIDFSYIKCIKNLSKDGYKSINREDIIKAFRFVIKPQINEFRNFIFGEKKYLICEVLGVNFSKTTCHIDHKPPKSFTNILDNFLIKYNLKLDDVKIIPVDGIYNTLEDDIIRSDWFNYHKKHAELRAIHRTANLAQKKSPKIHLDY